MIKWIKRLITNYQVKRQAKLLAQSDPVLMELVADILADE